MGEKRTPRPVCFALLVLLVVILLVPDGGDASPWGWGGRRRRRRTPSCSVQTNNGYRYSKTLATRMIQYSSVAYVKDHSRIRSWTCVLCKTKLRQFTPTAVLTNSAKKAAAYVGYDSSLRAIVVAFRGSTNFRNWVSNVMIKLVHPCAISCSGLGRVHKGFYDIFRGLQSQVLNAVRTLKTSYPDAKIYVTGHSLGGALATLMALDLQYKGVVASPIMINFGSPRVGDKCFASAYSRRVTRSIRMTHPLDIVTWLPAGRYHHVGRRVYDRTTNSHVKYLGTSLSGSK